MAVTVTVTVTVTHRSNRARFVCPMTYALPTLRASGIFVVDAFYECHFVGSNDPKCNVGSELNWATCTADKYHNVT